MRDVFCQSLVRAASRKDFVFLTGDLGYAALEPLRDALGNRFINAGVAEQNMVAVAAGLARRGLRPWCYSIAPFLYARPFEQIRNDVAIHHLPVVLVGNGGGYGYGVMGATHHAIEDYGAMLTLTGMRCFVPAFDGDVSTMIDDLMVSPTPAYFRLGRTELPKGMAQPGYNNWRKLCGGGGATLLACGPLVGGILHAAQKMNESDRPCIWLVAELPLIDLPTEFKADVIRSQRLIVIEEHVAHGSVGQMLTHRLMLDGIAPRWFAHRTARAYPSGRYGSQTFHRKESGLDVASVLELLQPGASNG
jgi:transketolase